MGDGVPIPEDEDLFFMSRLSGERPRGEERVSAPSFCAFFPDILSMEKETDRRGVLGALRVPRFRVSPT